MAPTGRRPTPSAPPEHTQRKRPAASAAGPLSYDVGRAGRHTAPARVAFWRSAGPEDRDRGLQVGLARACRGHREDAVGRPPQGDAEAGALGPRLDAVDLHERARRRADT